MKKSILLLLLLCSGTLCNAQTITTIVGVGSAGYSGDGLAATVASVNHPNQIAYDASGNLYVADRMNNVIRKINPSGIIATIAGTGVAGYSGDGGAATLAQLRTPSGILIDASGNIYISDTYNNVIRKVSSSGIISTIAGNGTAGYAGDNGPATAALLNVPCGLAFDASGNLIFADFSNNAIRVINTSGQIFTVAGNGSAGFSGDGGAATLAKLNTPQDVCLDPAGNLFIADASNSCIRKVNTSGIISTLAGTGVGGYNGDGISASLAQLYNPFGIVADGMGNIYFADQSNNRVRMINSSGIISTIAGTGSAGFSGDGGNATSAQVNIPSDVITDAAGNIIIADQNNNRVRRILMCTYSITNQPKNDTVLVGNTAKYWVTTTMPSPVTYQWQEDAGSGFVNLTNVLPYSGVNTDTLTIRSVVKLFNLSHYRCVISNGSSCTDTSSSAILVVQGGVGVHDLTADEINVFPNPAHDEVTVRLPSQYNTAEIQFINTIGVVVIERKITGNTSTIHTDALPAGLYIAKIEVAGQVIYKKIFKN